MSLSLNSVMLIGFLAAAPVRSELGAELVVLTHPHADLLMEVELSFSSGNFVHVRLPASMEEFAGVLRRGDRVLVLGSIERFSGNLGVNGGCESTPLVHATRVERIETLKSISNSSHPLHPKGESAGRLAVRRKRRPTWLPSQVRDSQEA